METAERNSLQHGSRQHSGRRRTTIAALSFAVGALLTAGAMASVPGSSVAARELANGPGRALSVEAQSPQDAIQILLCEDALIRRRQALDALTRLAVQPEKGSILYYEPDASAAEVPIERRAYMEAERQRDAATEDAARACAR